LGSIAAGCEEADKAVVHAATRGQQFDVHPNQIRQWKDQLLEGAAGVFGDTKAEAIQPLIDVKTLHAKIGELTLENDFLGSALAKAGLPSAKR
jgi:transposase